MIDKDEQLEENIRFLAKYCNAEYNDIRLALYFSVLLR